MDIVNLSTPTPNKHSFVVARGSILLLLLVSFLFFEIGFKADFILADESFNVVINEITWMGTKEFYNDEWIELYNNSDSAVNLSGWTLKADDGSPEIELSGRILSKSFYLLERTDDETVAGVLADQIYKGGLANKGECLKLFDEQENLIDKVDCSDGWFAGDNKTKQTMERSVEVKLQQVHWQTSQEPGGTPKKQNSQPAEESVEVKPQPFHQQEVIDVKLQQPNYGVVYPSGIVVNEVLPSPEGPDAENEWIEIFNENNLEVDISGWKISDTVGSVKSYIFPKGTKISGKGFLLLNRPKTKITLNNSGEGLKIFNPNGKIVDEINFGKALLGQSYNKFDSQWQWSENLTPGSANIASSVKKDLLENSSPEVIQKNLEENKNPLLLSSLLESPLSEKNKSSIFKLLMIALSISVCFGFLILFLKKKLKTD